ncbi:prepilin peptidase [Myceligenerans xiligouense]|uniref:Leader peptidase (Prepilin peptidase)/N-methyltransferase n=1 Tax=Myceligenerans xiligouense TaxID=253184 RepID=A0A3N4YQ88_9MICO|nr:A24 family peptidase [Myceligenerans xiligouense]RPF22783.1 leader peptidase (prepilin peptidase)/N-methyltransferase [Myceligenerans xiligouense]
MTESETRPALPAGSLSTRIAGEVRPFARAVAVVAVLAVAWSVWAGGASWVTPAVVVLGVSGAALGVIDARTHRLPNVIVYPTTAVVGVLLVLAAVAGSLTGGPSWEALGRAALGFAAHAGFYLLMWLIFQGGIGLGDVKLAGVLGAVTAWWGWDTFLVGAMAPYALGGAVAVALLLFRLAGRKSYIPFGPFMLLGVVVALTWHHLTS